VPQRTTDETVAIFDRWADEYDADLGGGAVQYGPLAGYASSLDFAGRTVARRVDDHARLLDIGIGTGAFAATVITQHRATSTLRVIGIDPSAGMRRRVAETHPAFTLHDGDFLTIPGDVRGVDAIISSFAFHEVEPAHRAMALSTMVEVLRPGGTLALLDIMFASPGALAEAEAAATGWDPAETYHLVGELDELLREAGLGEIQWWQTAPMHWLVMATLPTSLSEATTPADTPAD
jgi:putative AdoMet-dependent methyltransferase